MPRPLSERLADRDLFLQKIQPTRRPPTVEREVLDTPGSAPVARLYVTDGADTSPVLIDGDDATIRIVQMFRWHFNNGATVRASYRALNPELNRPGTTRYITLADLVAWPDPGNKVLRNGSARDYRLRNLRLKAPRFNDHYEVLHDRAD